MSIWDTASHIIKQVMNIPRRITAGWTVLAEHRDIFKVNSETHAYFSNDIRRGNIDTH